MDSNIPTKPAYGVYISQLVRIGRICEDFGSFADRHYLLTKRLIRQGYTHRMLCVSFKKFSLRHSLIFRKFKTDLKKHITEGICLPLGNVAHLDRHVTIRGRK